MSVVQVSDRFWRKVAPPNQDGCRLWLGGRDRDGYGLFYVQAAQGHKKRVMAHRQAWELRRGPITSGLTIDHWRLNECLMPLEAPACSKLCVEHIRVVSALENMLASPNVVTTECKNGHPYTARNTYRWRDERKCRTCNRAAVNRHRKARGKR